MTALAAVAINCTLKPSPEDSSCDRMLSLIADALGEHDVTTETIRAVDLDIKPGTSSDEGDGDAWPPIRQKILDAQILVIGTPIWLGNPSSVCRRVLERLDALLSETDDDGRMITFDRVGIAATVGNEDGAHNVSAQVFQALSDVGFTIPAGGHAYWVGEAMGSVDFKDLDPVPEKVTDTIGTMAANAAHLARQLAASGYPAG
ncbi:flavodoxin family protein [Aquihabitans sp. McL0605]|uniref:flavodoxin family protein n=1 Tax=Aquihabitans sp. McL0605 TaxID=3415671 RepID=UPI003CEAC455